MKKYLKFVFILLITITVLISISCKSNKSESTKTETGSVNEIEEPSFLTYTGDEFPKPIGYINDYADLIDKSYEDKISTEIKKVKDDTEADVVVVTLESLSYKSIEDYALELYNAWEVSRYGIILLVSVEGGGLRITTGYDMENVITNDISKSILNDVIIPELQEGNISEGIYKGVKKISEYILAYGTYTSESSEE